jgi:hypothetical protein
MTTSTDIVNQAIQLMGAKESPVTGTYPNFDSSPAGTAANALYGPTVQTVARQFGWDFSRNTAVLVLSGNAAPFPWTYEYLYPTGGLQIRQILPASVLDANNPLPVTWEVANNSVNGTVKKVIQTNQAGAYAVFTNNPPESLWDPLFREAVARLLASELAMALAARPDAMVALQESAIGFTSMGIERRD